MLIHCLLNVLEYDCKKLNEISIGFSTVDKITAENGLMLLLK